MSIYSTRRHTSAYVCWRSSNIGYASRLCEHTSAYVSIRQHTSAYTAYAITRVYTSAYTAYAITRVLTRQHICFREAVIGYALTDLSADNFARHVVVCAVLSEALPVSIGIFVLV